MYNILKLLIYLNEKIHQKTQVSLKKYIKNKNNIYLKKLCQNKDWIYLKTMSKITSKFEKYIKIKWVYLKKISKNKKWLCLKKNILECEYLWKIHQNK